MQGGAHGRWGVSINMSLMNACGVVDMGGVCAPPCWQSWGMPSDRKKPVVAGASGGKRLAQAAGVGSSLSRNAKNVVPQLSRSELFPLRA
jgi:hypothetical protein